MQEPNGVEKVMHFHQRTTLLLVFWMIMSVLLGTIFYSYDSAIVIGLNKQRSPFWDVIWLNLSKSAGIISYSVASLSLIMIFVTKCKAYKFRYLAIIATATTSAIMVTAIKYAVRRVRPFHQFVDIHKLGPGGGFSYPSGHTCDAFFLATILALLFPRRTTLIMVTYCWAILVSASRLYLGVHYPSDIFAGIAVSSTMAFLSFLAVQRLALKSGIQLPELRTLRSVKIS
ncbi:undecaprenyl-diphosphatase [bacterium A37T11]|nr:undecaprenyl-diphosphatase [bacterium A37T11]